MDNPYAATDEFKAGILAQQVPVLQQQNTTLQIELAWRDQLLAAKDAEIARLRESTDEQE
jgi:hypothetical protein